MDQYPKVPQAKIGSLDVTSAAGGLDQRGEANIAPDAFAVGRNVMVNEQGLATYRLGLKRWLPDTVDPAGQAFPALWDDEIRYVIADDGKIKWCVGGASAWTDAGGDNSVTTDGTTTTFIRVLNNILVLNGEDTLPYLDLETMEVGRFEYVADPTLAPTSAYVGGLASGNFKLYYAIWYSGVVGKTKSAPILTVPVNKIREQWSTAGTEGITITDPNVRPVGAVAWNLGLATAPAGGTIQFSDILPLALGLDINTTTFTDNGSITQLTNAGTAPDVNSTEGPKAKYGIEIEGRPFLYGIKDDPYAVLIGGNNENALNFTEGAGGYRLVLNEGTNYYPKSVTGFRNGQGIPSITVLFSNTEGLSKQSIIDQNTVSLGTFSATVWGSTEQNYGAAGVSSPYAVPNYRGTMIFPTVDGILRVNTQASLQNVLSAKKISDPVMEEIDSIRTDLLEKIVGTAWSNMFIFAVPARGFTYNNKLVIYDITRDNRECWYVFDITAQWVGTVSPPGSAGFVYVAQDNHYYRLEKSYVARDDTPDGLTKPFPFEYTTALIGTNAAHSGYFAVVQGQFYLSEFIGSAVLKVTWRDYQSGRMKTKTKPISNGEYARSPVGGWSSPGYLFNQAFPTKVLKWSDTDVINDEQTVAKISKRYRVPMGNIVTNELQGSVVMDLDGSGVVVRSVSFQGQALGISPDVR